MESRTMALARGMVTDSGQRPCPSSVSSAGTSTRTTVSSSYSASLSSRPTSTNRAAPPLRSLASSRVSSIADRRAVVRASNPQRWQASIYDYLRHPVRTLLRPVSAVEHYWAMRALKAETLLLAQEHHRQDITAMSVGHDEKRTRDMEEMHKRYEQEFARIRFMVWTILIVLSALLVLAGYFLFQLALHRPPPPSSKWMGPMHFTIPILSPFASVIEHETSAVNVPLVAVLLFFAGLSFFVWFRCCMSRR